VARLTRSWPPRSRAALVAGAAAAALLGCTGSEGDAAPSPAEQYLNEAVAVIREHAYYAPDVDWQVVGERIERLIAGAESTEDAYGPIRYVLGQLGDRHSLLIEPSEASELSSAPVTELPSGRAAGPTVAYLELPGVPGLVSPDGRQRYVETAHEIIARLSPVATCGWIVDLRRNHGGGVPPMLGALIPLLGNGPYLGYTHRGGDIQWYTVVNGSLEVLSDDDVELPHDDTVRTYAIVVLTSQATASAAEGVALALRGAGQATIVGEPTSGVPTGNQVFELSDGALLALTTALGTTPDGETYDGPIQPDIEIDDAFRLFGRPDDAAVTRAMAELTNTECA
jgi:carboxyl-terminal processing protease